MRQRLLNLLTVVSLLVFVALAVVWAWTFGLPDLFVWRSAETDPPTVWKQRGVYCGRGRLGLSFVRFDYRELTPSEYADWASNRALNPLSAGWRRIHTPIGLPGAFLGFGFRHQQTGLALGYDGSRTAIKSQRYLAAVPFWALMLAAALLPGYALLSRRRRRREERLRNGLCPTCGYDLRATPGRCPECGSEPPAVG